MKVLIHTPESMFFVFQIEDDALSRSKAGNSGARESVKVFYQHLTNTASINQSIDQSNDWTMDGWMNE